MILFRDSTFAVVGALVFALLAVIGMVVLRPRRARVAPQCTGRAPRRTPSLTA